LYRIRTLVESLFAHAERAKDALLYSSAYLAIIAIIQVETVVIALSLPSNPAPFVVGLLTLAVYVGDRIADADTDEVSNPKQCAFVRRHKTALSVLSAGSYGLAVAISAFGGPAALAITLLPGAFWVIYATDWLPGISSHFQRLKDVLVVNSAIVALAWALTLIFLPLAFTGEAFTPTAAVVFTYFFFDTFVNTEIPNIRDIEGDAAIGVSTLPVVFGIRRSRQIFYALDVLLIAFVGVAFLGGLLSAVLTTGILVGLGYALVLAALVGRTEHYGRLTVAGEAKHLVVITVVLGLAAAGF
jgi:4-hydroxybenzoate polyprenyltransferase